MYLIFLLLLACKHVEPPEAPPLDLGMDVPRIPAPQAMVYTTISSRPKDLLVAALAADLPWNEALSGAAGALALQAVNGEDPEFWAARWAAYRAGFPHPLRWMKLQVCSTGCQAEDLLESTRAELREGDILGLARARGAEADYWVALIAHQALPLAPVPRELDIGATVTLLEPGSGDSEGSQVMLVSPAGDLWSKPLDARPFSLGEGGEWWLQVERGGHVLLAFPLYVGIDASPTGPFPDSIPLPQDPGELGDAVLSTLDELRGEFAWLPPQHDPIMRGVASARVQHILDPQGTVAPGWPGSQGSCRATLKCRLELGEGLERCFRDWYIRARARAPLLDPDCNMAGASGAILDDGALVVLELGQD